jgi:hypothetical protein
VVIQAFVGNLLSTICSNIRKALIPFVAMLYFTELFSQSQASGSVEQHQLATRNGFTSLNATCILSKNINLYLERWKLFKVGGKRGEEGDDGGACGYCR